MNINYSRTTAFLQSRTAFIFAVLLFRASLDFTYLMFVSPLFGYSGFDLDITLQNYVESWLVFVVIVLTSVKHTMQKPSDLFVLLLVLALLGPLTSQYGLANEPRWILYSVLLGFTILRITSSGRYLKIPVVRNGRIIALGISAATTFVAVAWLLYSTGLSYINFDFGLVYLYRDDVSELIQQGWFTYITLWVYKVFNLLLFAYSLHKKNWVAAAMLIGLQVFFFGISTHKAVLFYPLTILFIWFYFRRQNSLTIFPFALFCLVIGSFLLWKSADLIIPASLFIRRVFFSGSNNIFDYYQFFEINQHVYWSNSALSLFLDYPYDIPPAQLIGQARGSETHANNSFLSTGYMHAGIVGIFIYSAIAGIIFRLIDSLCNSGVPLWLGLSLMLTPVQTLILGADLPTALVTHGLFIAMVMLILIRTKKGT